MLKSVLPAIFGIIFLEFLVMGISLGVLPAFVHNVLGYSNTVVGVVIGAQYIATLVTRHFAGKLADTHGGRKSARRGIVLSAVAGLFCLLAQGASSMQGLSLGLLLIGRLLLGVGESFLVIGIFAWGFHLVGQMHIGKVMVWNGMGMYGGMAAGAPLGISLQLHVGLSAALTGMVILPLLNLVAIRMLPLVDMVRTETSLPFYKAIGRVWKSGTGLALATVGFGGIASFISLYFQHRGFTNASLALTTFGAAYIAVRLFFAHFPDKHGGEKVVIVSLVVEVIGQVLIGTAPSASIGIAGACLTGAGLSLVFPSFGQMAVKHIAPAHRGMAVAAYSAFFDLSIALTAPLSGLIAGGSHYDRVYTFGAIAALAGIGLAVCDYLGNGTQTKRGRIEIQPPV
jgi:MFS family permease